MSPFMPPAGPAFCRQEVQAATDVVGKLSLSSQKEVTPSVIQAFHKRSLPKKPSPSFLSHSSLPLLDTVRKKMADPWVLTSILFLSNWNFWRKERKCCRFLSTDLCKTVHVLNFMCISLWWQLFWEETVKNLISTFCSLHFHNFQAQINSITENGFSVLITPVHIPLLWGKLQSQWLLPLWFNWWLEMTNYTTCSWFFTTFSFENSKTLNTFLFNFTGFLGAIRSKEGKVNCFKRRKKERDGKRISTKAFCNFWRQINRKVMSGVWPEIFAQRSEKNWPWQPRSDCLKSNPENPPPKKNK